MAKRGHGEGNIRKRADGRWEAQITVEGRKRRSYYGHTRAEVLSKLREAQLAQHQGRLSAEPKQMLGSYLDAWLISITSNVKPRTRDTYDLNVRRLKPLLGRVKLDQLRPAHVQAAYAELEKAALSARTIRQIHLTLHKALKDAMRLELVTRNVTDGALLPRIPQSERPWFTAEELDRLFRTTAETRLGALWVILGTAGLRLGEALGLKWEDIDISRRTLLVNRTLQRRRAGGGLVFAEPKSARSRRTIDLGAEACAALQSHQERQAFERKTVGAAWSDSLEIASILGHSSPALVWSTYGHVAPSVRRRGADLMDGLLAAARAAQ
jgi:integrase